MAADRSAAYCYFGGPWDGELVMLQPGWPFPAAIEHPEWLDGHYRADDATRRYVWRAGPWRAEIRP